MRLSTMCRYMRRIIKNQLDLLAFMSRIHTYLFGTWYNVIRNNYCNNGHNNNIIVKGAWVGVAWAGFVAISIDFLLTSKLNQQ